MVDLLNEADAKLNAPGPPELPNEAGFAAGRALELAITPVLAIPSELSCGGNCRANGVCATVEGGALVIGLDVAVAFAHLNMLSFELVEMP